jgi:hypothetical protein
VSTERGKIHSSEPGSVFRTIGARFHAGFLAWIVLGIGLENVCSQEALQSSISGEELAAARRRALENPSGNIQLGPVNILAGSALGVEFNNNISYSDIGRQEDAIFRPAVSMTASTPLTEANGFYATLDISYAKYLKYTENDRLVIQPGTQLGFDIYVGDFHFDLHDNIALKETPVAQGTISGVADYSEFSNTAGLGVDWDLNDLTVSFGYDHENTISMTSTYSYLDHASENFFARAALQFSQALTTGPEASAGLTAYNEHVLDDSVNYSFGGFINWQPTSLFNANIRFGYTAFSFTSRTARPPAPDSNAYYLGFQIGHRVNEVISYSIDAGRQVRLGVNSELIDIWYARPRIDWHIFEKIGLETHLVFENGIDSGDPILHANENYTLLGGGISANYLIMEKVLVGLAYNYAFKDSDLAFRDYHQHKVEVRIQYTF